MTGDDPEKFGKEITDQIRQGWSSQGISQHISWSEKQEVFKFGFIAVLMKEGL